MAAICLGALIALTLAADANGHHRPGGVELRNGCHKKFTRDAYRGYAGRIYRERDSPLRDDQKARVKLMRKCMGTRARSRWAWERKVEWRRAFRARRYHQSRRLCGTTTCNGRLVYWMESRRSNSTQGSCLKTLAFRESGWDERADNQTSSAYGIPQALPGSKMASHGVDWAWNPVTQIRWMMDYVRGRYGSACGALSHSYSAGWY